MYDQNTLVQLLRSKQSKPEDKPLDPSLAYGAGASSSSPYSTANKAKMFKQQG